MRDRKRRDLGCDRAAGGEELRDERETDRRGFRIEDVGPQTISVKREGRRWYVILACDEVPAEPLPATGSIVGIDMGTVHFFTDSGGVHVENPKFLDKMADELTAAQQHLSPFPKRTKRRTKKHRAAARKVAKLHAKIWRQRLDHHHKQALALVREHDVIGHEKLNTAGMTKAPAPKPDPAGAGAFLPNGAAAKAGLNRSILDAGWGQFLGILANKAESAGRRVIPVDARNTSRTCPLAAGGCGHVAKENRVTQAKFECVKCGFVENADRVGALNVLHRAGLVLCDAAWPATQEARDFSRGWSHACHFPSPPLPFRHLRCRVGPAGASPLSARGTTGETA
ncbi:transposase [Streptomyces sp. PSKA30]|uniref:RNA-guided endonuclease InsQ/TnpB family protein n=1 Tax=Streptomyces sp. PSKA30 TaxID=2874597 RepID=UPI0021E43CF3|nr:transposase [Streptomyces sp. PSKA30]